MPMAWGAPGFCLQTGDTSSVAGRPVESQLVFERRWGGGFTRRLDSRFDRSDGRLLRLSAFRGDSPESSGPSPATSTGPDGGGCRNRWEEGASQAWGERSARADSPSPAR